MVSIDWHGAMMWYIMWHPYEFVMFMAVMAVLMVFMILSVVSLVRTAKGEAE